jgi:hypothetical protein
MKAIPENSPGPQWNNKLLDDLVFIKKHLRYPISKKTIPSVFLIAIFIGFAFRMATVTLLVNHKGGHTALSWFFAIMIMVIFGSGILSYLHTLRFKSIPTSFFAVENMRSVEKFLKSQQLNTYRHPKAPEVFQIVSRPLGHTEQREVMIFIADDKRILVNSHFINQKWSLNTSSRNARKMANRLAGWLKIYNNDRSSADGSIAAY